MECGPHQRRETTTGPVAGLPSRAFLEHLISSSSFQGHLAPREGGPSRQHPVILFPGPWGFDCLNHKPSKGLLGVDQSFCAALFLQLLGQLDAEPSPIQGSFKKPCFLHPHTRHTTERRAASQVCPLGFVFSSPHPPTLAPYLKASGVGIFIHSDSFRQRPNACLSPATLHRRSQGTPSAAAGDAIRGLTPFLLLTGLLVVWSRSKAALKNGPTYRALWPGARPALRPGMMLHGAPHKHKRMISHVFRIPSSGSEPLRSG